jgi:hypothetical protein
MLFLFEKYGTNLILREKPKHLFALTPLFVVNKLTGGFTPRHSASIHRPTRKKKTKIQGTML